MSYNVKLDIFEGPLDLLLFFIKRDEINIYDIPIAHITREYLEYLEVMKQMNLHLAGEFILMAALLMRIKVQMLLPQEKVEVEEEIEDPRTELVRMLVEYQKYKDASAQLKQLAKRQLRFYPVNTSSQNSSWDPDIFLSNIGLIDLGIAFKKILDLRSQPEYYEIEISKVNLNQQAQLLRTMFLKRKRLRFSAIASVMEDRIEVVVTFLAILEMVRTGELRVSQKTLYGEIYLAQIQVRDNHVVADA
jgi:segregation and condensation protein A